MQDLCHPQYEGNTKHFRVDPTFSVGPTVSASSCAKFLEKSAVFVEPAWSP